MITKDGPKLYRVQRALRRSRVPGADAAPQVRPARRHCSPPRTACSRRSTCAGTTIRHSPSSWRQGLSGQLCQGHARSAASMPRAASRASRSSMPAPAQEGDRLLATGGRVLNVTARGQYRRRGQGTRRGGDRQDRLARRLLPHGHRLAGDRAREGAAHERRARPVSGLCRARASRPPAREIYLRTGGSGPPLLLLHGYPHDARHLAQELPPNSPAIARW